MSNLLITFEKDYADEFSVYGMTTTTVNGLSDYLQTAEKADYPVHMCFGSNECFEFESYEDLTNSLTVHSITGKEADRLETIFGGTEFGWFPSDIVA